jgi:hypothetical protein
VSRTLASALEEFVERALRLRRERDRLERENKVLREALVDIEMETRKGGQWTTAEINEVANIALAEVFG